MAIDFGHNCTLNLPSLRKCRKLIQNYRQRPELQKQRWLSTQNALIYLGTTEDVVIAAVDRAMSKWLGGRRRQAGFSPSALRVNMMTAT